MSKTVQNIFRLRWAENAWGTPLYKKETMDVLKSQKIGAGKAKKSLILEFKDFAGKINAEISIDVAKGGKSKPIPKSSPKKKKKGLFW